MNITRLITTAALGLLLLTACGQETSVSVTFEGPGPLQAGTPVYLNNVEVGEVAAATVTGDLLEAELSLDPKLTAGLNAGSAALLDERQGQQAILLYNYRPGKEPLQSGGELVGLNNSMELAVWRTGEAVDSGKQSMDEMTRSVTEYFESEEWQRRKEQINQRMEDLKSELGEGYGKTNQAYREFMESLESQSEAAREQAQESYDKLAERLREDVARLKSEGNEKLVEPLLQLLEDLSRAMEKKPKQEST